MVPDESKVMHIEDDILNFSPIRQNRNTYPSKEKNCGGRSSMVILDNNNLCYTIISGNKDLSSNNIPESRYSVLPYPHISGTKYRICSGKTYTATNINI